MKYFLFKLIPPRPTFPQDIPESEGKLMQDHVAYWRGLGDKRTVLIFGPVLDPDGMYGIAIIETNDETVVQDIGKNDPAIKAEVGFRFETYPYFRAR
jgi:uncharacterized protein YciI